MRYRIQAHPDDFKAVLSDLAALWTGEMVFIPPVGMLENFWGIEEIFCPLIVTVEES